MYRKRRKIKGYRGTVRVGSKGSFKFIFIAVVAIAIISALITGVVLGKNAEKSEINSFGRHNLNEFGGVDKPAADYAELDRLNGVALSDAGNDRQGFKSAVGDVVGGNAVAFWANDSEGKPFFTGNTSSVAAASSVTAEEIERIIYERGRLSVALFDVISFKEADQGKRIVRSAEEIALLSELVAAGIDEILLFNLPDDSDLSRSVTAYLALTEAECERANICVVLSEIALKGSGAARMINATEGYADAYAADLRGLSVEQLAGAIEKYAYFISNYNMRLIISSGEQANKDSVLALLDAYGIESYILAD